MTGSRVGCRNMHFQVRVAARLRAWMNEQSFCIRGGNLQPGGSMCARGVCVLHGSGNVRHDVLVFEYCLLPRRMRVKRARVSARDVLPCMWAS